MIFLESPSEVIALAFETSTAIGRVALGRRGEVLAVRTLDRPRAHAVGFLPAIAELCREQGVEPQAVEEVYVSCGPGSFTGLRIGITAARMIAFANGARIVPVPTLDIIAQNAFEASPSPARVAVILDAKRGNVYTASFECRGGVFTAVTPPVEAEPLAYLKSETDTCAVLGEGVLYHRSAVTASGRRVLDDALYPPRAETVLRMGYALAGAGAFVNPRDLVPTYIRPPEAEEKWAAKRSQPIS